MSWMQAMRWGAWIALGAVMVGVLAGKLAAWWLTSVVFGELVK